MRKHLTLLAAASLAAGSYGFLATGLYAQDDARNPADVARDRIADIDVRTEDTRALRHAQLPPGTQVADKDDSEDIRKVLSQVAEASLTKNGFDNMVKRFVDADRNRIGEWLKGDDRNWDAFNDRVKQINDAWKAKYDEDFDIDHKLVYGPAFRNFTIVQGEIVDPLLMSNWPVQQPDATPVQEGIQQDTTDRPGNRPGDRNIEKGRKIAVLSYPASHGMPDVYVSMLRERPDSWKIDVPDHIGGEELYNNLMKHLEKFANAHAEWPQDKHEAQRMATHHVLMAIYGVEMPAAGADHPDHRLGEHPVAEPADPMPMPEPHME